MKKYLFGVFFILLASLVYTPSLLPVHADCITLEHKLIETLDTSNNDPDFWTCKSLIQDAASCYSLGDCKPLAPTQCAAHIKEIFHNDKTVFSDESCTWTSNLNNLANVCDKFDQTFATCYSNLKDTRYAGSFGTTSFGEEWDKNIDQLIQKKQREAVTDNNSSTTISALHVELKCGFADDLDKNSCCTNSDNDVDPNVVNNVQGPDGNCLLSPGIGNSCWLSTETLIQPVKKFVIDTIQKQQKDFTSQVQDKNPDAFAVPKCIVGKENGLQGTACKCLPTGGADICKDINPYNDNTDVNHYKDDLNACISNKSAQNPSGQEALNIASYRKECETVLNDKYNATGVSKYKAFDKSCSDCMSNNTDDSVNKNFYTAIGCIPATPDGFIAKVFEVGIGLAGLIAFICIIYSAFLFQTSQGDAEKVKKAQELMTSCITGLIMIIFSVFILQVIGVDILKIPGFTKQPAPTSAAPTPTP